MVHLEQTAGGLVYCLPVRIGHAGIVTPLESGTLQAGFDLGAQVVRIAGFEDQGGHGEEKTVSYRNFSDPDTRMTTIGFRCAKDAK